MFYRCRNLSRDALRVYNLPLYNVLQTKIRFVYNFIENEFRKNMQNEKVHFQVGNFLNQLSMQSKIEILIRWHCILCNWIFLKILAHQKIIINFYECSFIWSPFQHWLHFYKSPLGMQFHLVLLYFFST